MNGAQPEFIINPWSEPQRSLPVLPKLSEYFEIGTKFFALSASIVSVLGFLVFVRYCVEISYFPELTLAASAGLFGAIFSIGVMVILFFFIPYLMPWFTFSDNLNRWEYFRREGFALRTQIGSWMLLTSCIPCFSFMLIASAPKIWRGRENLLDYLFFGIFALVVILGLSLPIIVESKWLNTALRKVIKRCRSVPLPRGSKGALAAYGGLWAFVCFAVSSMASLGWGRTGMWTATGIVFILLALGLRGAFEPDPLNRWILGSVVLFLSLWSMFISPVFPAAIVRALGLAGSGAADVVIEKRYSEVLQAEGIPMLVPVDGKKELGAKRQPDSASTYLEGLNNDTILLRNVRVLLRVGGQVALSEQVAGGRATEINNGSLILIPATQVLAIRESRHSKR